MSASLIIILPVRDDGPWVWVAASGETGVADTVAEKSTLAGKASKDIDVILPGQWARTFPHELPKMRESERVSAAAFSIEDQTGAPVKSQHVVLGGKEDDRIAVIAADKMQAALTALSEAGLNPDGIYADFDAFAGSLTPIRLHDRVVVPGRHGHALDPEWDDGEFDGLAEINTNAILALVDTDKAINLRQGAFARRTKLNFGGFGLGRAAALLAMLGLSWGLYQGAQARALSQQAAAFKVEAAKIYTKATGKPAPANVALAVRRAMKTQPESGADFLRLSNALFAAIEQTDGVMIDVVQYNQNKQELVLRLIYPEFESASALERAASVSGARFRPGGVREQGGELIGDAVFSMGGSS